MTAGLLWPLENTLPGHWGPLADPHGLRDGWCDAEPLLAPGGIGNDASSVCRSQSSRLCKWGSLSAPHTWDAAPKAAHPHPKSRGQSEAWRKAGLSGRRG